MPRSYESTNILDKIIRKSENISLTGDTLLEICDNETMIVPYSKLKDVNDLSELLNDFDNFIVFYETTSQRVGHYTCVIFHRNQNILEFFDPYGQTDATLLGFSETSYQATRAETTLSYLIQQFCSNRRARYIYNANQLQSADFDNVATCGRYVAVRIKFRYMMLNQFVKFIKGNDMDSDYIVTLMTFLFHDLPEFKV